MYINMCYVDVSTSCILKAPSCKMQGCKVARF